MSDDTANLVGGVIARAPEWMRRDLASSEPASRERAEETLAAMITMALAQTGQDEERNGTAAGEAGTEGGPVD